MIDGVTIKNNLEQVYNRITTAAQSVGRKPTDVQLIVVSKGQPSAVIQEAINAGVRVFGENYPEETIGKLPGLTYKEKIEWHMIGHLQSRKAKIVGENFDMLHSLDRIDLAIKLNRIMIGLNQIMPCLIEVNVSGEKSKGGFEANDTSAWPALTQELIQLMSLSNLQVRGLMCMPPLYDDPEGVRPYFVKTRKLQDYLQTNNPTIDWAHLSMGTSGDFETAIQEGATFVRIGRSILGPRTG